jgi:flagellar assembly protein FliH
MSAARKYMFDLNFDAEPAPESVPAAAAAAAKPSELQITAAELEQARKKSFAEGQAAAQAAAQAEIQNMLAAALQRVAEQIALLLQAQEQTGSRAMRSAIATAVAILRKLQPEIARRKGLVEIESILGQCLESMRDEPRILVRVNDSLLDPLRERLEQITTAAGFDGRVVILADDALGLGDCRVEWADGGTERDTTRLWREIDAALARMLVTDIPPAQAAEH